MTMYADPNDALPSDARPRFLSEADCADIARRLTRLSSGGGITAVAVWSHWSGHVNWARNRLLTSGDVRNNYIRVSRNISGTSNGMLLINQMTDAALAAAAQKAERWARVLGEQDSEWDLAFKRDIPEEGTAPQLFRDATYQLDAEHRATAAVALTKTSAAAGMLSAGQIEVSAHSVAVIDSLGHVRYVPYTQASYSVTVRDPEARGAGWAGVDWLDWDRIDTTKLTSVALDKCLSSRNPVAVEPGHYTTILEPQSVSDFVSPLIERGTLDRGCAEYDCSWPTVFSGAQPMIIYEQLGMTKLGQKVMDERISIWSDPMDPDAGFVPFSPRRFDEYEGAALRDVEVFHPATWIKNGVVTQLAYDRDFAVTQLGQRNGLPAEGGFRMSGGTTSVEEMIASTERGLLVTRFTHMQTLDQVSQLQRGFTRDGLWLIEKGKISKAVKNMVFTESILAALNSVEFLGVPQRVYRPSNGRLTVPEPVIVPPLKIRDFSFTALADAV
jgi:predicted Zn-dependent protease